MVGLDPEKNGAASSPTWPRVGGVDSGPSSTHDGLCDLESFSPGSSSSL